MANIIERPGKNGKISYMVRIRIKGCKKAIRTFRRKTDAVEWLTKTKAALLENRDFPERDARKHTVNDLIKEYKENGFADKEASKEAQTRQLDWWAKQIGHLRLIDLTPKAISETITVLKARKNRYGEKIDNATINRYKSALSAALQYAVKTLFWLHSNPARTIPQLKEKPGRVRYLSKDEFLRLSLAISKSRSKKLLALFLFAVATGVRRSEALRVEWRHIDFESKSVSILKSKNGEPRTLPIGNLAWSYLLKLHNDRVQGSTLIFHGRNPDKPICFDNSWRRAIRVAGIEGFRWHDNRHTAGTYLRKSGATIADIAEVLGHKTLAMAWRYSRLEADDHRPKVVTMNNRFLPETLLDQAKDTPSPC